MSFCLDCLDFLFELSFSRWIIQKFLDFPACDRSDDTVILYLEKTLKFFYFLFRELIYERFYLGKICECSRLHCWRCPRRFLHSIPCVILIGGIFWSFLLDDFSLKFLKWIELDRGKGWLLGERRFWCSLGFLCWIFLCIETPRKKSSYNSCSQIKILRKFIFFSPSKSSLQCLELCERISSFMSILFWGVADLVSEWIVKRHKKRKWYFVL